MFTPAFAGTVTVIAAFAVIPLYEAVTVVEPAATPVAKPPEATVATAPLAVDHCAVAVTSVGDPPAGVAVAVNCWVAPMANDAVFGDTETVSPMTVRVVLALMPFDEAVIFVAPEATAVARPDALIVAIAGVAAVQVAVTGCVEPSL